MSNGTAIVTKMLKQRGQMATLVWDTPGLDVDASSARQSVPVFINGKRKSQDAGVLSGTVDVLMPITKRDLTNARLIMGGKNYQIVSFNVVASTYQEVVLAWG